MSGPFKSRGKYGVHRERMATEQARQSAEGRDIANLMREVKNPIRRARCARTFRLYVETYCLKMFTQKDAVGRDVHWPWADYHLQMMKDVEGAVLFGEKHTEAVPRGGAKTTLLICGAEWAMLYGHRRWVCLLAATGPKADNCREDIKTMLETNPDLADDFPEVVIPIQALERRANRQLGQTYNGVPTRIKWGADEIVLADIPMSRAAGATFTCGGMDAAFIRGQVKLLPDGTRIRPDLVLLDDPQTDDTARSEFQTRQRLNLLSGAILHMGPPGRPLAALAAVTVIVKDDMADQMLEHPQWRGLRVPMLIRFPLHMTGGQDDGGQEHGDWWDQYGELYTSGRAEEATERYAAHRGNAACQETLDKERPCRQCPRRGECMDCEAIVSWQHRKYPADLSALQHAMNEYYGNADMFAAELQQRPQSRQTFSTKITAAQVLVRTSGLAAGMVPAEASCVTGYIDVHDDILYWCLTAWTATFEGWVIDYGTFPKQPSQWFRQADPPRPMRALYPKAGKGGVLAAGIEELAGSLLRRELPRSSGGLIQISRLLIDARYDPGQGGKIIDGVRRKLGSPILQAAKGRGIGAKNKPIASYQKRPGWLLGDHWYIPNVAGTKEYQYVSIDTNYWKSFIHAALAVAPGDSGALLLFGSEATKADHEAFADHVAASEYFQEVTAQNTVNEWKAMAHKPDNHWFDCLVGTAVAASMQGCKPTMGGLAAPTEARQQRRPRASSRVSTL